MDAQSTFPKKRPRGQRKREAIRRHRRREAIKAAEDDLFFQQQLARFIEENSEPYRPEPYTCTYYEKINGKRHRITLYTYGGNHYVWAYFDHTFDPIFTTPDGKLVFLPDAEEPTAPPEKLLEFARNHGVMGFPIHPKYDPPKAQPKPRLVKAKMNDADFTDCN
jgi:hypothetical protein